MTTLLDQVDVGAPDVAGPLAVFPLFGPEPRLEYISHAEGAARGVTVTELPEGATVGDLLVLNPLDVPVLLYEGEELLGAQQNRTIDAAVLVPAGEKLRVPVSCVEQNRWEGARHGEAFERSPQTASPRLRRAKSVRMHAAMAAGAPARADQSEVWSLVGPGAMSDAYDARAGALMTLMGAFGRRDGQTGALAAIGGRFAVLDQVSRADAFAALYEPLLRGYAMDALSAAPTGPVPSVDDARAWISSALSADTTIASAVGLGRQVTLRSADATATGLLHSDELIQLSVYGDDRTPTRISRPSRRR